MNAITVDVEEWFHICGVGGALAPERWSSLPSRVELTTRLLLEDLTRAGVRATFFVLGWVARHHPALVAEIVAAGHEVGSHGDTHTRVYELDRQGFARDLDCSLEALQAAGAGPIHAFRAPEWSITERSSWALEVLAARGVTIDASMAPVRMVGDVRLPRHPHTRATAAGPIVEVPPLVVDRFGQAMPMGWGWALRMTPPARVLRAMAQVNAAGRPTVLMVHPWEIDPQPPRVRLPARLRFAHYFRLDGFRERLAAILAAGQFGALGDLHAVRALRGGNA